MSIEFKLPEVSEGVTSADVAEIHVAEGDVIEAGQIVLEVETEKAVADIPCPHAGKVTKIHVKKGDSIPVGATLLTIEAAGAESAAPAPKKEAPAAQPAPKPEPKAEEKPAPAPEPPKEAAPASTPALAPSPAPAKPAAPKSAPATASQSATAIARVDDNGANRAPAPAAPSTRASRASSASICIGSLAVVPVDASRRTMCRVTSGRSPPVPRSTISRARWLLRSFRTSTSSAGSNAAR